MASRSRAGKPPQAAFLAISDAVGRAHFRPNSLTSARAQRFARTQLAVLKGHCKFSGVLPEMAASLVLYDGICTRQGLGAALMATSGAYRWEGQYCIDWLGVNKFQDRRILSRLSARHLVKLPPSISSQDALHAVTSAANTLYPRTDDPVATLLGDAQAWLLEVLPGALVGGIIGTNPQVALPKSALARLTSGRALVQDVGDAETPEAVIGIGLSLEAYFNAGARTSSSALVDEVIDICRRDKKLREAADRRRMLLACLVLSHRADLSDAISTLILAWIIDLIESGAVMPGDLHPGTIEKYVRLAASALRIHFLDKDIEEMEILDFVKVYEAILSATSDGQKRIAASAITSWHAFLVTWLDVPPLKKSLYAELEVTVPKANIVWDHEKRSVRAMLADATMDPRLCAQIRIALEIAMHGERIRAGELFRLRVQNVRIHDNLVEIEVCPMLRDGKLKTPSARRVLTIRDDDAQRSIIAWTTRREKEGAIGEDLLWGDPHQPSRVYQLGRMYAIINQLLRAVTGDRNVSLHTLSHSWISISIRDALIAGSDIDINPLDVIAVSAGHMTVQTSLTHYFHLFEVPLRHFLDLGLSRLEVTSADAERLSGTSADALRQRTRSRRGNPRAVYWEAILGSPCGDALPYVADAFSTTSPQPPAVLSTVSIPKFSKVANALSDLTAGLPKSVVALRCGQDEAWVDRLVTAAVDILRDLPGLKLDGSRRNASADDELAALQGLQRSDRIGIDFRRADQEKFLPLRTMLESATGDTLDRTALGAWEACYRGRFLAFENPDRAAPLIRMLGAARVPFEQIAISVSAKDPSNPDGPEMVLAASLATYFQAHFPMAPLIDWKAPRRGRPRSYLMWSSGPLTREVKPAGASMSLTGLNALMLAATAFAEMSGDVPNSSSSSSIEMGGIQ